MVVCSTLEMSTSAFRRGAWTAVQFLIKKPNSRLDEDTVTGEILFQDGDGQSGATTLQNVPYRAWVGGDLLLDAAGLPVQRLRAANSTMAAFYIVVSARAGGAAMDTHAVSGLRLECVPFAGDSTYASWIVDWSSLRQPLTPPPFGRPPPPDASHGALAGSSSGLGAAAALVASGFSAALAFGATLLLLSGAAVAWHARAQRVRGQQALLPCKAEEQLPHAAAPEAPKEEPQLPQPPAFDAFLSYRRADWRIVDAVQDKLTLAGLRVFKDVDGAMTGRPFDVELLLAVRSARAFAPVVTLASLQRMAGAATSSEPDTSLAEWLAALYFRDADEEACVEEGGARPVRLIHPLLVGTLMPPRGKGYPACWCSLAAEPAYAAALAALPDAVAAATVAMVDGALRRALGRPLPPRFACLTVRDIVLGRAAPPLAGILSGQPFSLECSHEDLGLYMRGKFAPALLAAR
jgi:hypothetical protein